VGVIIGANRAQSQSFFCADVEFGRLNPTYQ
jgi:hypothetical protein